MRLKLYHLYEHAMNLYGDQGNVLAFRKRCEWRGIGFDVVPVRVGDKVDYSLADIVFMGGGQDRAQRAVADDLTRHGRAIRERVEEGMVVLAICGGFQLFGHYFRTKDGVKIPGIGVFDALTIAGDKRFVGNAVVDVTFSSLEWATEYRCDPSAKEGAMLVGFENHSGLTYLEGRTKPLGAVMTGWGNTGDGQHEGGCYKNAFGTYLHGSLLPKNPWFCDHLIHVALANRYDEPVVLERLDDSLETRAHQAAIERARTARTIRLGRGPSF